MKAGKLHYGYKKHHATDMNGMVLAVETTPANVHDNQALELLVERAEPSQWTTLFADKGYCSKGTDNYLRSRKFRNGVMKRAWGKEVLSTYCRQKNKAISALHYVV